MARFGSARSFNDATLSHEKPQGSMGAKDVYLIDETLSLGDSITRNTVLSGVMHVLSAKTSLMLARPVTSPPAILIFLTLTSHYLYVNGIARRPCGCGVPRGQSFRCIES